MKEDFAGYISKIVVNGRIYKLRCEIVEVHAMTCTKCGSPLKLHYGSGTCEFCGTSFSTRFEVIED